MGIDVEHERDNVTAHEEIEVEGEPVRSQIKLAVYYLSQHWLASDFTVGHIFYLLNEICKLKHVHFR